MEFNRAYSRDEFLSFLRVNFLPEDFRLIHCGPVVLRVAEAILKTHARVRVGRGLDGAMLGEGRRRKHQCKR